MSNLLTFRDADGERIPGTSRHAFIRDGDTYFLTDLVIYADGLVDCWGLVTMERFEEQLRGGWVATEFEEGARASAYGLGAWRFAEPHFSVEAEDLLAQVRDEIEKLNGRPTSSDRCRVALDAFLADRTEDNRAALRAAYLEIPRSQRVFVLGDMDRKDLPLKVLAAGPGGTLPGLDTPVSTEVHESALEYFADIERGVREARRRTEAEGCQEPRAFAVPLHQVHFPKGWPEDPGVLVLRNEYPAPVRVAGLEYPTVTHAYWALSTDDSAAHEEIRATESPYSARALAEGAPRRDRWKQSRPAVMADLLRAKFDQHPALTQVLLDTGDAVLLYDDGASPHYWGQGGRAGRNWMGRLLELVRSELHARRAAPSC